MRFSSAAALLLGAVTADTLSSVVQTEQIREFAGSDGATMGTLSYTYWHTWEEATPDEITFYEKYSLDMAPDRNIDREWNGPEKYA